MRIATGQVWFSPFQVPLRTAACKSMLFSALSDSTLFGGGAVPPQEKLAGDLCWPLSRGQIWLFRGKIVISLDLKLMKSVKRFYQSQVWQFPFHLSASSLSQWLLSKDRKEGHCLVCPLNAHPAFQLTFIMKSLAMFIYLFVCFWWLWGCTYSWKSQEMVQTWSSNFQGGSVWYHTFAWSRLVHIPKGPSPFPWLHTLSGPLLHTWLPSLLLRRARLCSIHLLLYWLSVQPVSVNGHFSVQEQRKRCPIFVLCKSSHSCPCSHPSQLLQNPVPLFTPFSTLPSIFHSSHSPRAFPSALLWSYLFPFLQQTSWKDRKSQA